ncbi:MAG TPA: prepilin-type N-terminal cleavage/methylation domain-containing protein [Nitrospiria bacterium]|jgi:prepilin-type N-terminal cleavage/methylation domain-containing protein|nr:prepilin-type N-terminal cleavage/methylation domain-containing protein [Nitrospiria bacterium]
MVGYGEDSSPKSIKGRGKHPNGFTLLELMVVGAILGILVGIAVPIYISYLKRARQVEAPVALNEVKRLETMYFAFSGGYGTLNEIGYHSSDLRYYTVTLERIPPSNGDPPGYKATATGNIDSDSDEDVWTIVPDGTLEHVQVD